MTNEGCKFVPNEVKQKIGVAECGSDWRGFIPQIETENGLQDCVLPHFFCLLNNDGHPIIWFAVNVVDGTSMAFRKPEDFKVFLNNIINTENQEPVIIKYLQYIKSKINSVGRKIIVPSNDSIVT